MPTMTRPRPNAPKSTKASKPAARPKLYTTEEVAAFTDRAPVTIKLRSWRLQHTDHPFGMKIGRQWLYTEDEIRDLAAIPSARGRAYKSVIEARRQALEGVPLDQLAEVSASLSDEPEDGSEAAAS